MGTFPPTSSSFNECSRARWGLIVVGRSRLFLSLSCVVIAVCNPSTARSDSGARAKQALEAKKLDLDITKSVLLPDGGALEMTLIPAGKFRMGDTRKLAEFANSEDEVSASAYPVHRVALTEPYYISKFELTQRQWAAIFPGEDLNPSIDRDADLPVHRVLWDDAVLFAERLGEITQLNFSLPTEAQWEYACRAGSAAPFPFSSGKELPAALRGTALKKGGSYAPNEWGVYDMIGNASEWCLDWLDPTYYKKSPFKDPIATEIPRMRYREGIDPFRLPSGHVIRGGDFSSSPDFATSASRGLDIANAGAGIRLVLPANNQIRKAREVEAPPLDNYRTIDGSPIILARKFCESFFLVSDFAGDGDFPILPTILPDFPPLRLLRRKDVVDRVASLSDDKRSAVVEILRKHPLRPSRMDHPPVFQNGDTLDYGYDRMQAVGNARHHATLQVSVEALRDYPLFSKPAAQFQQSVVPPYLKQLLVEELARLIEYLHPDQRARASHVILRIEHYNNGPDFSVRSNPKEGIYISPLLVRAAFAASANQFARSPLFLFRESRERPERGTFRQLMEQVHYNDIEAAVLCFKRSFSFVLAHELAHLYLGLSSDELSAEEACDREALTLLARSDGVIWLGVYDYLLAAAFEENREAAWGLTTEKSRVEMRQRISIMRNSPPPEIEKEQFASLWRDMELKSLESAREANRDRIQKIREKFPLPRKFRIESHTVYKNSEIFTMYSYYLRPDGVRVRHGVNIEVDLSTGLRRIARFRHGTLKGEWEQYQGWKQLDEFRADETFAELPTKSP